MNMKNVLILEDAKITEVSIFITSSIFRLVDNIDKFIVFIQSSFNILCFKDTHLPMEDACNDKSPMVFTIENKTDFYSPNYPNSYPNNIDCTWKVLAFEGFIIKLTIEEGGQIETEYDTLIFKQNTIIFLLFYIFLAIK